MSRMSVWLCSSVTRRSRSSLTTTSPLYVLSRNATNEILDELTLISRSKQTLKALTLSLTRPQPATAIKDISDIVETLKTHGDGAALEDPDILNLLNWILGSIGKCKDKSRRSRKALTAADMPNSQRPKPQHYSPSRCKSTPRMSKSSQRRSCSTFAFQTTRVLSR